MIIVQAALQRGKQSLLEYSVPLWIGENRFLDAIASLCTGVGQLVRRDARSQVFDLRPGVYFFFREERPPIGYDQAEITGADLVDARVI
jgi:hypothetical protein